MLEPELTTIGGRDPTFSVEQGAFKLTTCVNPVDIAATGKAVPVANQPLYDAASVKILDAHRVELAELLAGRLTWKGLYAVSKDRRAMTLDFEDDRAEQPVTGRIDYVRVGEPLARMHGLSGTWHPEKLERVSESGSSIVIQQSEHELVLSRKDGSRIDSMLDANYYPISGYVAGATASILHPGPDLLAVNTKQGITLVDTARAVVSADGNTLSYRHVDRLCGGIVTLTYQKKVAP
jgi:hypothetical protein